MSCRKRRTQRHANDSCHVRFRSEDVNGEAQRCSNFAHDAQALLVVRASATNENRYFVLDQMVAVLSQRFDDALERRSCHVQSPASA